MDHGTSTAQETGAFTSDVSDELIALRAKAEELSALSGAISLLAWDERTKMPRAGAASRARQLAVMSGLAHERGTSDEVNKLISAVEDADPGNLEARYMRRHFDIETKFSTEFVSRFAEARSLAEQAWKGARDANDFAGFAPQLETIFELSRERADIIGYETERYDALHDLYEQGSTAAMLEPMFAAMREPVHALIAVQPEPDTSVLERRYPVDVQATAGEKIIEMMGFDLNAGRVDSTTHPFCQTIGGGDVRLTTRFDEHWLPGSLFSTIHEAGHGIYEQSFHRLGLPPTIGHAPGLGMHESQSRMYENYVGRGAAFWQHAFPTLQADFPEALGDVSVDEFVAAVNVSKTSLIRVEADELTYNMHVAARFELERALVNGTLAVSDLPEAWSNAYEHWVGIRPEDDANGCLQDVHWAAGLIGYFPTYTLGNVYAAQFVQTMTNDIPDVEQRIARGEVGVVRGWFDEHIYRHGAAHTGIELVNSVTGGPVDSAPLIAYLNSRFGA